MARPAANPEPHSMSFGEHLDELRRRMILGLAGLAVASTLTFYYGQDIVAWLVRPLAHAQIKLGLPPQTYNFNVMTGFMLYMKVGLIAGAVIAAPWIIYQLWRFISAGLYPHERRVVMLLAPFSSFMVAAGVLFAYYILIPAALSFMLYFSTTYPPPPASPETPVDRATSFVENLLGFTAPSLPPLAASPSDAPAFTFPILNEDPPRPVDGQAWIKAPEGELRVALGGRLRVLPLALPSMLMPLIEINSYINFVLFLTLAIVIAFQLPVVMLTLGWARLVSPALVARYRRHCIFGCFALAAVLTPTPDPFNMTLLALPLWVLYELGLLLMRFVYRPPTDDLTT